MGVRERLASRWGQDLLEAARREAAGQARSQAEHQLTAVVDRGVQLLEAQREASEYQLAEALASYVDPDEYLYRPIGERAEAWARSLGTLQHHEVTEAVFELYKTNPLGHRITELTRDYIVGDGLTYSCMNPNVEDVVGDFWHDDDNDLDERNPQFALELGLYGELIPEAHVGENAGVVKLGYIDPSQIKRVTHLEMASGDNSQLGENTLIRDKVWIRKKNTGAKGLPLDIIRKRGGTLSGDVFYFGVNAVSNSPRGWPDMLHIADWLDAYDRLLWEITERARFIRAFIWDVTIKNMDQPQIDAWLRKNGAPPRSGTVRAHNDQIEWNAVAPQMGSYEAAKETEVLLEHIGGGAGIPKHWLSSAEDINRATAAEMGAPTVRKLSRRQNEYVNVVKRILRFVIDKAVEAKRIRVDERGRVEAIGDDGKALKNAKTGEKVMLEPHELVQIHAPEISPKDVTAAGAFLNSVVSMLSIAEDEGLIGHDTARQVLALGLQHIGYDYDPNTEDVDKPEDAEVDPRTEEPPSRRQLEEVGRALAS